MPHSLLFSASCVWGSTNGGQQTSGTSHSQILGLSGRTEGKFAYALGWWGSGDDNKYGGACFLCSVFAALRACIRFIRRCRCTTWVWMGFLVIGYVRERVCRSSRIISFFYGSRLFSSSSSHQLPQPTYETVLLHCSNRKSPSSSSVLKS